MNNMIFGESATQFLAIATTFIGVAMALAYLPQTYRIIKRKSSGDISLLFFSVVALGITFWLLYGLALDNWPLIIVNAVSLIAACSVILATLRYRKK
jgi:MtN3 and saliva related transmembrane protein